MVYQLTAYLSFLRSSTNQHGVHSPFVYAWVTQCLYDNKHYPEYKKLLTTRKKLRKDTSTLSITEYGAGSRVFSSNQRTVSAIAKHAGITYKRQKLLFRMMRYFQPDSVLELGTSLGMATWAMALGNSSANIHTVEGCKTTAEVAKNYFKSFRFKNIQLHIQTFDDYFKAFPLDKVDLVYLDGSHDKKNTLALFNQILPYTHNDTVVIFDDIYWSKEMTEAWTEITQHPNVTVSVDTFFWGIIFFRKEQKKQHFTLRV